VPLPWLPLSLVGARHTNRSQAKSQPRTVISLCEGSLLAVTAVTACDLSEFGEKAPAKSFRAPSRALQHCSVKFARIGVDTASGRRPPDCAESFVIITIKLIDYGRFGNQDARLRTLCNYIFFIYIRGKQNKYLFFLRHSGFPAFFLGSFQSIFLCFHKHSGFVPADFFCGLGSHFERLFHSMSCVSMHIPGIHANHIYLL